MHRATHEKIPVVPIPGPSSILAALCASGLPTDQFRFEGFIPKKPGAREKIFQELKDQPGTFIFFDTQHRILKSLSHLLAAIGNRQIVVARELTKINEEFLRGTIEEVSEHLTQKPIKGELTLLVHGLSTKKRKRDYNQSTS